MSRFASRTETQGQWKRVDNFLHTSDNQDTLCGHEIPHLTGHEASPSSSPSPTHQRLTSRPLTLSFAQPTLIQTRGSFRPSGASVQGPMLWHKIHRSQTISGLALAPLFRAVRHTLLAAKDVKVIRPMEGVVVWIRGVSAACWDGAGSRRRHLGEDGTTGRPVSSQRPRAVIRIESSPSTLASRTLLPTPRRPFTTRPFHHPSSHSKRPASTSLRPLPCDLPTARPPVTPPPPPLRPCQPAPSLLPPPKAESRRGDDVLNLRSHQQEDHGLCRP